MQHYDEEYFPYKIYNPRPKLDLGPLENAAKNNAEIAFQVAYYSLLGFVVAFFELLK